MAGRHRARNRSIQIIDIKSIPASAAKRAYTTEFHDAQIKFPLPHRVQKTNNRKYLKRFRAQRPHTVW